MKKHKSKDAVKEFDESGKDYISPYSDLSKYTMIADKLNDKADSVADTSNS